MLELTEEDALQRLRAQDPAALSWLIGRYNRYVASIVCAVLGARCRVQDAEELTAAYHLPLLGSLYASSKRRRPEDVEAVYRQAAAKLEVQLPESEEILLTGTLPRPQLEDVATNLQKHLRSHTLRVADNPTKSADSTARMLNANVVLAEARKTSDMNDVSRMMDTLQLCHVQHLGLIEL